MATDVAGRMWDLVVVGGGPAGSSAAIAALRAAPSASVLLLDRQEFPRDKCCGDAVLSRAADELAQFGVDPAALLSGYEPSSRLRLVTSGGLAVGGDLPETMTVIPRAVFDTRLVNAAYAAGAQSARHAVRRLSDRTTHVEIDGSIRARWVIGADGAESVVRRAVVGSAVRNLAVAIRGYDSAGHDQTSTMVFGDRRGLSYAWRFPCSDGRVNVGYGHLLRAGEKATRSDLVRALRRLLPDAQPEADSLRAHRLPLANGRQTVSRGRLLLAGDAAALVNPLSGEGIYYAVASGLAAGAAAVSRHNDPARQYRAVLRRRFAVHQLHAATMASAARMPGLLDAGLTGVGADATAFADLAQLGLADGKITGRLLRTLVRQLVHDQMTRKS